MEDPDDRIRPVQPDPSEPQISVKSLVIFKGLLEEDLSKVREERIFQTTHVVRFVDGHQKVYGGGFIARIIRRLVDMGFIPQSAYDDHHWSPTFGDLLKWIEQLIEKLLHDQPSTT